MLLIGDIGGTNARLAYSRDGLEILGTTIFSTAQSSSLAGLIEEFQRQTSCVITKACVAIAASVVDGVASLTNGSWTAREDSFSFPMHLVNDLEAAAWGISSASSEQKKVIQKGQTSGGLSLVIGVGTGLGMAIFDQNTGKVYPTEVGHSNFAPFSIDSLEVWEALFLKNGRVRNEDVLSGIGLENILDIYLGEEVRAEEYGKVAGEILCENMHSGSSAALEFFAMALGSFLGDQCIAHNATQVFLCGGVAQKMEQIFSWDCFRNALREKEPMSHIVENAQIELLLSSDLGLLGALNIVNDR
jgi:glucokinase